MAVCIMKFATLVVFFSIFSADGKSLPTVQDDRKEDLLAQCLAQILSKVMYKTNPAPLDTECKNILKPGSDPSTVVGAVQNEVKKPRETNSEDDGERSQEEFPSFVKRILARRQDMDDERSQEEFPNFVKRIMARREELDDERSQEEFPSYLKRRIMERRDNLDDERSQEEFPSYIKRKLKNKRNDVEDERSQEEFPNFYKRGIKPKREQYYDRSQEEFPQKRNHNDKRDDPDDERSQEEFPSYPYKRNLNKNKRGDSDYDRSQEDFPSYLKKRNQGLDEQDEESQERDKRYWKPSHRYHHKKKYHKRDEETDWQEPDYDRSQEAFPTIKRNHADPGQEIEELGDMNSPVESDEVEREIAKRYWKPKHRYHHKKHHKRSVDPATEDYEVAPLVEAYDYLTKKKNGLEEHEHYHPAWSQKTPELTESNVQNLEDLAKNLRYKRSLESPGSENAFAQQRILIPGEKSEKLDSAEQHLNKPF